MADHNVKLEYKNNTFKANPPKIAVKAGHSISFALGVGAPSGGKFRVTFQDPQFFSKGMVNSGDGDVQVTATPVPTRYKCELLVNGQVVATDGNDGGDIVPGSEN